jgi:hypothetical protein
MKATVGVKVSVACLILFLVAASRLVFACSPSPAGSPPEAAGHSGSVEVATDRADYRPGDPLTLSVHNRGADTIAFNPCTRTLEAEQGGGWTAVPEPARICTMEAWILAPGESRAGPTELPADLAAGRYRAVLGFSAGLAEPPAGRVEARTAPFAVKP